MRVFYVFDIKPQFKTLYAGHESVLFSILKQLYYMDHTDVDYGYYLFSQLTNRIQKEKLDHMCSDWFLDIISTKKLLPSNTILMLTIIFVVRMTRKKP